MKLGINLNLYLLPILNQIQYTGEPIQSLKKVIENILYSKQNTQSFSGKNESSISVIIPFISSFILKKENFAN